MIPTFLFQFKSCRPAFQTVMKPPIVFAVRGLEHPEDYYQSFEHSTDDERSTLLHDCENLHDLNKYQKELRSQWKVDKAGKVLAEIRR